MIKKLVVVLALVMVIGARSYAAMSNFVTYTAEGAGISIDAVGLFDGFSGNVQADIPVGAEIYRAYLYSASIWSSSLANVQFDGNTLTSNASSRLDVGSKMGNDASENRWDVTSLVTAKVGSGSGLFNFNVKELADQDGEILAVIYKVAGNPVNTAFLFDGELSTTGDSFGVNLTRPFETGDQAIMSLGISFGYQQPNNGGQRSEININGARLTSSAGGQDDGWDGNGGLITAGGIGDDISNPSPFVTDNSVGARYDDELYNIGSFLSNGANSITLNTLNPSNDDNVFFMGLTVRGEATTSNPQVPEPTTMMLLGSMLMGMVGYRKVKSSN